MGTNMKQVLGFYARQEVWGFAPSWHGFENKNRPTKNAINSLVRLGYLEVNEFHMAHVTSLGIKIAQKLGIA